MISLTGSDRLRLARHIAERAAFDLRVPDDVSDDGTTATLTWTPSLTPDEQTALATIADQSRSETGLSADGYAAIRTQMQTLRALRQLGRNAFMGLSQAERDRTIYDALVAVTQVFIAMQRDS